MFCCVAWRMVLEPTGDGYPNLTASEFLAIHAVMALEGNICSFCSCLRYRLARFEGRHSNAKQWQKKFFLVSG